MMILKSYKRMPLELEQTLRKNVYPITVQKREVIQPIGTLTDNLYFVQKGLFQLFSEKSDRKVTQRFKKEDEFIISLKEVFRNNESLASGIEALEDGILWVFPGPLVFELQAKYIQFVTQMTIILAKDWIKIDEARDCSRPGAGPDNYDRLRQVSPDLLERVPLPYLSNFTCLPEHMLQHLNSSKMRLNVSTTKRRRR